MEKKKPKAVRKGRILSLTELIETGLTQQDVSRLVASKHIKRIGRGLYLHPKSRLTTNPDFEVAAIKFGSRSAIGGLSALFHYNLCDQAPMETWVLVPPEKRTSVVGFRLVRTKTPLDKGIVEHKHYRIVSVERAVLESLKLMTKIGERVAIRAARQALASKQTSEIKIGNTAKELGLENVWKKYFEIVTA